MRENELLEPIDLVLQSHKVGNGLITTSTSALFPVHNPDKYPPLIRIIDRLQADVFLVLEQSCARQYSPHQYQSAGGNEPLNSG